MPAQALGKQKQIDQKQAKITVGQNFSVNHGLHGPYCSSALWSEIKIVHSILLIYIETSLSTCAPRHAKIIWYKSIKVYK